MRRHSPACVGAFSGRESVFSGGKSHSNASETAAVLPLHYFFYKQIFVVFQKKHKSDLQPFLVVNSVKYVTSNSRQTLSNSRFVATRRVLFTH